MVVIISIGSIKNMLTFRLNFEMNFKFKFIFSIFTILYLLSLIDCKLTENRYNENFERKCGYEGCPLTPSDKLNIHLVPHTHDDVGWLKTVDQYYYGSSSLIQKAGVQYILDSVVDALLKDPKRRFIYVESAFFFKWWNEQTPERQTKVKQLIEEGRLEFIGGAWSMNDEGSTHYQSIIDQFAWGLKQLNDTFGKCARPRAGWQIDPFGHSREMASIFAGMGFDGLFFARLDYQDKSKRLSSKAGEMIWHSSSSLGKDADLFTGILSNHYSAPPGFCFDYLCGDEPIIDDNFGFGFDNNVKKRLNIFYDYIKNMTNLYATNNIMVPMGDDFNYQDANMNFKNMDKLIKYSKDRQVNGMDVNIFYSTPSCYIKSLNDTKTTWPTESQDFFPYSTDPYTYWSGYFTSRPTLKRFERVGNNFLQVCKKLTALYTVSGNKSLVDHQTPLREAMGIMQHHDAITGTEKKKVAHDYARLLHKAMNDCTVSTKIILNNLINPTRSELEFESCHKLNESSCELTENANKIMITLFNPLSHTVDEYIRIPIPEGDYEVKDSKGNIIYSEILPIPKYVLTIPNRLSTALNELVFKARVNSLNSYYVERTPLNNKNSIIKNDIRSKIKNKNEDDEDTFIMKNSHIQLTFNKKLLTGIKSNGAEQKLEQNFYYYEGAAGNNQIFVNRSSGAYIFRPNGTEKLISRDDTVEFKFIDGKIVKEVHQDFTNWNLSQVIRIYENESYVEFEWLVGPIDVNDNIGKEVITRFTSDINSNNIFYTDSNGREMIKRKYNDDVKYEKIAGNYYPVTTKIAIDNGTVRLAILNDRSQGGSSLRSGEIELMVHRRLLHDDAFGVGEALNETAYNLGVVARGKHYLYLGTDKSKMTLKERDLQLRKHLQPWIFISSLKDMSYDSWQKNLVHDFNSIDENSLPSNVNLMTLETWGQNQILIRYENILEINECGAAIVTFNIKGLFDKLHGKEIRETTLDGNQWLDETNRMEFRYNDDRKQSDQNKSFKPLHLIGAKSNDENNFNIDLKPMQIRTFIITTQ